MKKIFFLWLALASSIFAMENGIPEEFKSVRSLYKNEGAFLDLPYDRVVAIIKNLLIDKSENGVFDWVIRWAHKKCASAKQIETLLLHTHYQGLSKNFIKYIVSKAYLLFHKELDGQNEQEQNEQEKIKLLLKNFHRMAASDEADEALSAFIEDFKAKQQALQLPPRKSLPGPGFNADFSFYLIESWKIGTESECNKWGKPVYYDGFFFYPLIVFEKIDGIQDDNINKNYRPILSFRCYSKLLAEIKTSDVEFYEIDEDITITIKKNFLNHSLMSDPYILNIKFDNIHQRIGKVVSSSWHEALENFEVIQFGVTLLNQHRAEIIGQGWAAVRERLAPNPCVRLENFFALLHTKNNSLTLETLTASDIPNINVAIQQLLTDNALVENQPNGKKFINFYTHFERK